MAIGKTNAGGGGTSLNFKVVGGITRPTSPKENTIWVNTDVAIPGYTISGIETPGWAMTEGWVYINAKTGTASGSPEFNALKKNEILISPIATKQYVGSQWVDKEAKIYQGSQWVDWATYLYTHGDACVDITGGWEKLPYGGNGAGSTRKAPTLTMGDDGMTISLTSSYIGSVWTVNPIDLSNCNTLTMHVSEATNTSARAVFGVIDIKKNNYTWVANVYAFDVGEYMVDVSELTGSYYVVISIAAATKSITTDEIRLS